MSFTKFITVNQIINIKSVNYFLKINRKMYLTIFEKSDNLEGLYLIQILKN